MYGFLASLMDALGFDNFVEGRILTVLVDFQFLFYQGTVTQWTSERWAKSLIQRLLGITHRQWLFATQRSVPMMKMNHGSVKQIMVMSALEGLKPFAAALANHPSKDLFLAQLENKISAAERMSI